MKRILQAALVGIVFMSGIWGCKKNDAGEQGTNYNPIYNIPIKFLVSGLADITMLQYDTAELNLDVKYISGTKQMVGISITQGLPDLAAISFQPQIDTPDFSSVFRVFTMGADTGTYPLTLMAVADTISETYNLLLRIIPSAVNDAPLLTGTYEEEGDCVMKGNIQNNVYVSPAPGGINKVYLEGIWLHSANYQVEAVLNPADKTLEIPAQTNKGMQFSGSGTYTETEIILEYQLSDGVTVNENCTVTLTKTP